MFPFRVDMTSTTALLSALALLAGVNAWLLFRLWAMSRTFARVDERLDRYGNALELLADATESGLRDVAAELSRVAGEAKPARRGAARGPAAERRRRTAAEIAAAENVSEGEAGLRLRLAEARRAPVDGADEPGPAPVQ